MRPVKEKKERALGTKLFLKADRCNSPKCVMVRKPYRPGQHGQRRQIISEYGKQLREKQKIQIYYGMNDRQMRRLFQEHPKEEIASILEQRLPQVVFMLGFAKSPRIARQLVAHGHVLVGGRKVTIPSYHVRVGDVISIRPESKSSKLFEDIGGRLKQYETPAWLKLDKENLKGECVKNVSLEDGTFPFNIDLVGEFYSK